VLPYDGNIRVVRWRDRSFNADAFATFTLNEQGRAASIKMEPTQRPLILAATSRTWTCSGWSK
jgi:hypothetical protein